MNQKLLVANWKMFKSFDETVNFLKEYLPVLEPLVEKNNITLVITPTHLALASIARLLTGSDIRVAAQDVSAHEFGPYTGQIDARSLKALGITYCLIGHSEIREAYHVSDEEIALKVRTAINNNLIPIVCIGESLQEYDSSSTESVIKRQLKPVLNMLQSIHYTGQWYIAYEPIWAINSGKTISPDYLTDVLEKITSNWPQDLPLPGLLYGGSVSPASIQSLSDESRLSGFLVGKASLEIESLSGLIKQIK